MNGSNYAFNPLRTVQGVILGNNSLRKGIKSSKTFPSKSAKIGKKPMDYAQNLFRIKWFQIGFLSTQESPWNNIGP